MKLRTNICLMIVLVAITLIANLNANETNQIESETTYVTKRAIVRLFLSAPTKELFKVWHLVYKKEYDYNTQEGINRYTIFKNNLKAINQFNLDSGSGDGNSYRKGLNHLSDMTSEEIKKHYNLVDYKLSELTTMTKESGKFSLDDYNDVEEDFKFTTTHSLGGSRGNLNWKSYMRPTKNQNDCDSGWAFAAVAAIESNWKIKNSSFDTCLSPQQLVDCDRSSNGCGGGSPMSAFSYLSSNYIMTWAQYPYLAVKLMCRYDAGKTSGIRVSQYQLKNKLDDIFALLKNGPVAASVYANDDWFYYSGGIFSGKECKKDEANHFITLIGYSGDESKKGYWILRNSWGSDWGEDGGNMRIYEEKVCGVKEYGIQPVF